MHLVDSSGWIEFFMDQPNAGVFEPLIQDTENIIVPTICVYEVFKRLRSEFNQERSLEAVGVMLQGIVVDLDRQIALEAARVSMEEKLSLADSVILATAQEHKAILWTQDEHFKDIEDVKYIEKKK